MVFPNYDYKEFNNRDKSEYPCDWREMVALSVEYCRNLKNVFEFVRKCKDSDLPSFHPYWKYISMKNTMQSIDQAIKDIETYKSLLVYNPDHPHYNNIWSSIKRTEVHLEFLFETAKII